MRIALAGSAAAIIALASATAAGAAQQAIPFQARIQIETSCLVTASNLDFGNVGTIFGGETASASVAVVCSLGTPYTLSFSSISSVTAYNGNMVNGANQVSYSAALTAAGGSGPGSHAIIGVLTAQATPPTGIYTDNRTVFLDY